MMSRREAPGPVGAREWLRPGWASDLNGGSVVVGSHAQPNALAAREGLERHADGWSSSDGGTRYRSAVGLADGSRQCPRQGRFVTRTPAESNPSGSWWWAAQTRQAPLGSVASQALAQWYPIMRFKAQVLIELEGSLVMTLGLQLQRSDSLRVEQQFGEAQRGRAESAPTIRLHHMQLGDGRLAPEPATPSAALSASPPVAYRRPAAFPYADPVGLADPAASPRAAVAHVHHVAHVRRGAVRRGRFVPGDFAPGSRGRVMVTSSAMMAGRTPGYTRATLRWCRTVQLWSSVATAARRSTAPTILEVAD